MKRRFLVAAFGAAMVAVTVTGGGTALAKNEKINPNARLNFAMNMGGGGFSQRLQPDKMTAICDSIVGNQVFGTLIRRDTKTNKAVPNLAESWEVVDPSTFKITNEFLVSGTAGGEVAGTLANVVTSGSIAVTLP